MAKFAKKKTVLKARDDAATSLSFQKYKLVVIEGPQEGAEYVVDQDLVRVGTSRSNDLVIEDHTVSRRHFEIEIADEGAIIRDLASTNGTDVEGCRIQTAYLHPGARIGAGTAASAPPLVRGISANPVVVSRHGG